MAQQQILPDTGIWAKVDSKVSDLGNHIASVKNIETIIEIDASTLTADTIDLESVNELKMSTQGVGIGVAVNVASAYTSMVLGEGQQPDIYKMESNC